MEYSTHRQIPIYSVHCWWRYVLQNIVENDRLESRLFLDNNIRCQLITSCRYNSSQINWSLQARCACRSLHRQCSILGKTGTNQAISKLRRSFSPIKSSILIIIMAWIHEPWCMASSSLEIDRMWFMGTDRFS